MSIDVMFSRAVYINLDRRADRRGRMLDRLDRMAFRDVGRMSAVDGSLAEIPATWNGDGGGYGCLMSHKAAVASADADGCESLLVFEDDIEFAPDLEARVARALGELPDDWSFLYLGASHRRPPVPVGDSVARASFAFGTFAYAVRRPAFGVFESLDPSTSEPIDVRLARLQERRPFHCLVPNAVWVDCDYSDIQGTMTNHWYIKESVVVGDACEVDMNGRVALVLPLDWPDWQAADPSAAPFLADHFRYVLPGLHVVELEGGPDLDPAECARRAADIVGDRVDYVLVAGSPVLFSRGHLLGALQMCRRCSVVSPFNEVLPLSDRDATLILEGNRRAVDDTRYDRKPLGGSALHWGFYRRDALSGAGPERGRSLLGHYEVPSFGLYLGSRGRCGVGTSP